MNSIDSQFCDDLFYETDAFNEVIESTQIDESEFVEAENRFEEMLSTARSRGVRKIGSGGYRDVYSGGSVAGDDCVIKISRGSLVHNEHVIELWTKCLTETAKTYVAPLVDWSPYGRWIIQKRADGRGNTKHVGENLHQEGFSVSDLNGTNVGVYNGRSVLLDMGQLVV